MNISQGIITLINKINQKIARLPESFFLWRQINKKNIQFTYIILWSLATGTCQVKTHNFRPQTTWTNPNYRNVNKVFQESEIEISEFHPSFRQNGWEKKKFQLFTTRVTYDHKRNGLQKVNTLQSIRPGVLPPRGLIFVMWRRCVVLCSADFYRANTIWGDVIKHV